MFKVFAVNNISGKEYSAEFESEQLANDWKNSMISSGQWGPYEGVSVTITDITGEIDQLNKIKEVESDVATGEMVKKKISAIMRSKLTSGTITLEQMAEFVERDAVKKVERYLGEGYLQLAKVIILSNAFDPVTQEEKDLIVAEL